MSKTNLATIWKCLCLCGVALLMVGCDDTTTETVMDSFSISRNSVVFPVSGGTNTVMVATEDDWEATTTASWLTLNWGGYILYITASANEEVAEVREAEVIIETVLFGSATVHVRQEPAESPTLSVNSGSSAVAIDSEGGTFTISVKSNCDWSAALVEGIPGWDLYADVDAGLVSIAAEANTGDSPIVGTVRVSAGSGSVAVSEDVEVTQISRADNPYWQYTGNWEIYSADCYYRGGEWVGPGTYNSCAIAECSYANELLSLQDWGALAGMQTDKLAYNPEDGTVAFALGYPCGSATVEGTTYILYIVVFDEEFEEFYIYSDVVFTISEDGETITVSGITDDYPVIGYVGWNNSASAYQTVPGLPYCKAPLTFTKTEAEPASVSNGAASSIVISPVGELPDGAPAFLPKGYKGNVSNITMF